MFAKAAPQCALFFIEVVGWSPWPPFADECLRCHGCYFWLYEDRSKGHNGVANAVFLDFRDSHQVNQLSTTLPSVAHRPWSALLLKGLAAGALVFSLAGCIPIPVLDITPSAPEAGESVTFNGAGTIVSNIPADTVAVSYRWTFGDGTTGSGATATHTYTTQGSYEVTLRVIDSAGRVGETKETVTVSAATPTSDTTASTDTTADTSTTQ